MSYWASSNSRCVQRGYHVAADAGFGTAASATILSKHCRDCGALLVPVVVVSA